MKLRVLIAVVTAAVMLALAATALANGTAASWSCVLLWPAASRGPLKRLK